MDRRRALAVSVAVAVVIAAAAALAANFGLLGLVGRVEPVGQLSPVVTVGSTVGPDQGGADVATEGTTQGAPGASVGQSDTAGGEHSDQPDQPDQQEREHERDD
jgi:hypothetical protein